MARRKPSENAPPTAPPKRWVMLMPNLPGGATTNRVRVWRRLQEIGAVAVRPSVYVLPNEERHMETFQWVAGEITAMGGQASLCEGVFRDPSADALIEKKSIEARDVDYGEIGKEATTVRKSLRARMTPQALAEVEARAARVKKRFDEVMLVDFFQAPGRLGAEGLISDMERAFAARKGETEPTEGLGRIKPIPKGAIWVTRTGVHVDRIACAWLIKRFIDPKGVLKFVAPKGYEPQKGEMRYDMFDAELTHVGDRCSFEVILVRMGIDDSALTAIGEIVHDIDVRDGKFNRPETAGVESQITGVCVAHREDLARIAAATPLFEALYSYFQSRQRKRA